VKSQCMLMEFQQAKLKGHSKNKWKLVSSSLLVHRCHTHLTTNGVHTLMCAQRSITHKLTNYKGCIIINVITSRLLSHSLYNNEAEVKYKNSHGSSNHRHIDWLTASLVIFREVEVVTTCTICYPSGIFIQVRKINKRKYISYSTSVTWGS
jgi:hypothetical protein